MFPAARVITLGSAQECAVHLDDPAVAPRHAVLYLEGGKLMIADAGGGSGIIVNGQKTSSSAVSGLDDVRVGEFRIKAELMKAVASFKAPAEGPVRTGGSAQPEGRRDPLGTRPIERQSSSTFDPDASGKVARAKVGRALADDLAPPGASPLDPDELDDSWEGGPTVRLAPEAVLAPPPLVIEEDETTRRRPPPAPPATASPAPIAKLKAGPVTSVKGKKSAPPPPSTTPPSGTPAVKAPPPPAKPMVGETTAPAGRVLTGTPLSLNDPSLSPSSGAPTPPPSTTPLPSAIPAALARDPAPVDILPPPAHVEPDHDEDEEEEFVPPFSLLDNVVRERFKAPIRAEAEAVVEVIRYREGQLSDVARVAKGDRYGFFDARTAERFDLLRLKRNGRARLFFDQGLRGNVVIGGETTPIANLCVDANRADKKGSLFVIELGEGDFAHVKLDAEGYLVRFVRPPLPPPVTYGIDVSREDRTYAFSAFALILLMLGGIWAQALISPPELFAMEEEVEFAEVSLKDLELEKPEPTPEPTPTPTPEATPEPSPPPPAPTEKAPPEPPKKTKRSRPTPASPQQPAPAEPVVDQAAAEAANALAALDNIAPKDSKNLSAAVSNIAAVRVPNGAAKRFQVSGPIGKLPGNDVVLATGSTGRDTRAASKLLEGKEVAQLSGGGSGKVRGTVARVPARSVGTTGGTLSREEILKVVNAGIADIQRCYERELMKTPGLDGKVTMDWIIALNGTVQSTRVRSSTLKSEAVTTCISGVIKGWQFPKPVGGSVTVTYPFAFRGQSF